VGDVSRIEAAGRDGGDWQTRLGRLGCLPALSSCERERCSMLAHAFTLAKRLAGVGALPEDSMRLRIAYGSGACVESG